MTKQLEISILLEVVMVLATILLLTQPRFLFRADTVRSRNLLTISGLFLLCMTFCWSVIFGCVIAIHQLTFRL